MVYASTHLKLEQLSSNAQQVNIYRLLFKLYDVHVGKNKTKNTTLKKSYLLIFQKLKKKHLISRMCII